MEILAIITTKVITIIAEHYTNPDFKDEIVDQLLQIIILLILYEEIY